MAMKSYRVVVFDMGHVSAVEQFEATGDEEAIAKAKTHFPQEQRELWELSRFVARIAAESK
jgi:hypothetical protein